MNKIVFFALATLAVALKCDVDQDCQDKFLVCQEFTCAHKSIFPMLAPEFVGIFVLSALIGMANVGGIGGGGMTVPLVAICWGFSTKQSIAISGCTIFIGAIVRFFYSYDKKHPEKKATQIDYGIVIVMLPLVVCGGSVGVLVNLAFAPAYLTLTLTLLLIALTWQSTLKMIEIYKRETKILSSQNHQNESSVKRLATIQPIVSYNKEKLDKEKYLPDIRYMRSEDGKMHDWAQESSDESQEFSDQPSSNKDNNPMEQLLQSMEAPKGINEPLINKAQSHKVLALQDMNIKTLEGKTSNPSLPKLKSQMSMGLMRKLSFKNNLTMEEINQLQELLEAEDSHIKQWKKHILAFISVALNLLMNYFRSVTSPLEFQKCGVADWMVFGVFVVTMFGLSYYGLMINKKEQALKIKAGRGLVPSDIRYSGKQLKYLLVFAFIGGWVSGALGLGGGSIFNPLMIGLGVPPSVSTATGMYMIMFSTGASTMMYLSYDSLNLEFGLWLSFWCSCGILVGVTLVNALIQRSGRQSILVMFLVFMLALSAVLVAMDLIVTYASDDPDVIKAFFQSGSVC